MSQPPTPYSRQYNFAGFSITNPTTPHQGNKLDQEYNAILASVNQTISRLSEVQRDDGKVRSSALDLVEVSGFVDSTAVNAANSAAASATSATASKNAAAASASAAAASAASVNAEAITAALAGKAALVHTHAIADVTNLQTTLTGLQTGVDGKAALSHTHAIANVTGLQTALDGKAATGHTHAQADVTGLTAALADKVDTTSTQIAKAWVNFNGTGTVAIRAAFNVSSITDNGVGNYTLNFTTALADVNYMAACAVQNMSGNFGVCLESQTTTALRLTTRNTSNASAVDNSTVCVAVIR